MSPHTPHNRGTAGITAGAMTPNQRSLLMRLIDAYTSAMASDIAADRMARALLHTRCGVTFAQHRLIGAHGLPYA